MTINDLAYIALGLSIFALGFTIYTYISDCKKFKKDESNG